MLCMSLLAWDLSFCGKMSSARPVPCVIMRGVVSGVQSGQSQTVRVGKVIKGVRLWIGSQDPRPQCVSWKIPVGFCTGRRGGC